MQHIFFPTLFIIIKPPVNGHEEKNQFRIFFAFFVFICLEKNIIELIFTKIFKPTNPFIQANENLAQYGRPRTTPTKVKVRPGSTASQQRTPVKKERLLVIPEVDQRRDYAGFVLQQRMDNIDVRHKTEVMKLYLPYIQTTPSS